jgi:hypothetical protein
MLLNFAPEYAITVVGKKLEKAGIVWHKSSTYEYIVYAENVNYGKESNHC